MYAIFYVTFGFERHFFVRYGFIILHHENLKQEYHKTRKKHKAKDMVHLMKNYYGL